MAKANKTVETKESVSDYLTKIKDAKKRKDCSEIIKLMEKTTGLKPKMWGTAIVGFGSYHYKYDSGREGDAPLSGMAARANGFVLYLGSDFPKIKELLPKFGKHKVSGGCIHIQKLEDVDAAVLTKMIKNSFEHKKKTHDCG